MASPVCELRDVRKRYGEIEALAGVTATLEGQVIGLLGPNGAGKSTLLKVMLGLISFEGQATVLGRDARTDSLANRDRIGYMPEMDSYLAGLTAVELCTYAAELNGLPRSEAMQRAHAALYYTNLEDKRYQKVAGYSSGLKQRVKLAQALVHDPDLLFLDEPTNGLDPKARDEMLALIAELPTKRQCTIILSTHLLRDVDQVCDQVVIMQQGEVRFTGSLEVLRGGGSSASYEVEVKANLDQLVEPLTAAGCQVTASPPLRLSVTLPEGADGTLVLRTARASGVQVRHLAPATLSLEAAFLRELRDPGVKP